MVSQAFIAILSSLIFRVTAEISDCEGSLKDMITGKYENAAKMIYYSGRDLNDLGQYDECLKLGNARYILLVTHVAPINAVLGLCGPETCEPEDYKTLSSEIKEGLSAKNIKFPVDSTTFYESDQFNNRPIRLSTTVFIILSVIILGFVSVGTYFDILSSKFPNSNLKTVYPRLVAFSLIYNFQQLMKLPDKAEDLHVLNGIKVLSMLLISFSHNYVYTANAPIMNPRKVIEMMQSFSHRPVYAGIYIVDVFFVIAGFLVAYLTSGELAKRKGRMNWALFCLHRLIRIIPLYFCVYIFYICVFPFTGFGPAWPLQEYRSKVGCETYWYANFLFINNFLPPDEPSCMAWSWFIPNDLQFYLFSPLILILHYRSKLLGYALCILLLLTNILIIIIQASINDYNPGAVYGLSSNSQFTEIYEKPYDRIGAYVLGMMLGFLLRSHEDRKTIKPEPVDIELKSLTSESPLLPQTKRSRLAQIETVSLMWVHKKSYRIAGLVIGPGIMIMMIYITYNFENNGPESWSKFSKVMFLALEHQVFAFGLIVFLAPMLMGFGGGVKNFLSSQYFTVAARISFAYYLIHPIVILMYVMNTPQAIYLQDESIIYRWFGLVLFSMILSIMATLVIESPILNMEKAIFRKSKQ